jgi:ABC-type Fe3+ transport system permease subunit
MKRTVGHSTRNAILLGAVLGVVFCATSASAPVIYGVGILSVMIFGLIEDHFTERGLRHRQDR